MRFLPENRTVVTEMTAVLELVTSSSNHRCAYGRPVPRVSATLRAVTAGTSDSRITRKISSSVFRINSCFNYLATVLL